jgi:hypothetical protein
MDDEQESKYCRWQNGFKSQEQYVSGIKELRAGFWLRRKEFASLPEQAKQFPGQFYFGQI